MTTTPARDALYDALTTGVQHAQLRHHLIEEALAEDRATHAAEVRAAAFTEAADYLRDGYFRHGMSVQEIGTALRRMAAAARPDNTTGTGPATPTTPRCATCSHTKRDHSGRADHRARHSALVAGDPWCHACNARCDFAEPTARPDDTTGA